MICKPDKLIVTDGDRVFAYDAATSAVTPLPSAVGRSSSEVVEASLKALRPRRREKLLFLSASLFRQHVLLPKVQTDGLSSAEMASSLAFEVEPFSNLSRETGILAYRALPEDDGSRGVWDVLQISRDELTKIHRAVKEAGCVLCGVAGLPDGWDFRRQAVSAAQAGEVVGQFASGTVPFPVIEPPHKGAMSKNPFAIAAVSCVVLVLVCAIDYGILSSRVSRLAPVAAEREQLSYANATLTSQIGAKEAAIRAREQQREDHEKAKGDLAVLESAWGEALASMAGLFGEDAVITSIRSDENFRAVVEGVGATYKDVGDRFVLLSEPFSKSGWKLRPGSISERSDGSTVRFSFTMVHDAAEDKTTSAQGSGGSYYDDYVNY